MKSTLKVTGIDHVVLYVNDLSRAKQFYVELLAILTIFNRDAGIRVITVTAIKRILDWDQK